jgi:hypothetical protein
MSLFHQGAAKESGDPDEVPQRDAILFRGAARQVR